MLSSLCRTVQKGVGRWWAFWGPFFLRVSIALDDFIQAGFRGGIIGITISSRIGTAKDHGHLWGGIGEWLLNHCWPFGCDPVTGESHCTGAIKNDSLRAMYAIGELLGDNTVVEARGLQSFKAEILALAKQILEDVK